MIVKKSTTMMAMAMAMAVDNKSMPRCKAQQLQTRRGSQCCIRAGRGGS
jgi:hypothetical protein